MRKCVCHIDALHRNYPECSGELDGIKLEIEGKKLRLTDKITDYTNIKSFDQLIDIGLELQELIICQCIELRCKAQSIIINHLSIITRDAVLYHKAQSSIIKASTEGIKVQQEIVRFDRQNIELETDIVKRVL